MALFETWVRTDLTKPLKITNMPGYIFTEDNNGYLLGVEVFENGVPKTLTGSVSGYFVRCDDNTVVINGVIDGNKAYILIPQSACSVPGPFSVTLRHTLNGEKATLCAYSGEVFRTTTDTMIDPGGVIPDIDDLIEMVEEIEEALENFPEIATTAETQAIINEWTASA